MVVSRKAPVAPPPSVSRSSSSQNKSTKQKLQEQLAAESSKPGPSSSKSKPQSNGSTPSKGRSSGLDDIPEPKTSIIDKLFLFSLFAFAAYAAIVCPPYTAQATVPDSAPLTCKALVTYRTHVLEPYVIPPLKTVYSHTSTYVEQVSRPLVDAAHPYTQPVAEGFQKLNHVVTPKVVKLYRVAVNEYFVPWVQRSLLPRWNAHVAPRLQTGWENGVVKPLQPYLLLVHVQSKRLQRELHEHIHHVQAQVAPYWLVVKPKVLSAYLTAQSTYEKIQPQVARVQPHLVNAAIKIQGASQTAWSKAQPMIVTSYEKAKPVILSLLEQVQVLLKRALKEFITARRTYVDPHIVKILERVNGTPTASHPVASSDIPDPTEQFSLPSPIVTEAEGAHESVHDITDDISNSNEPLSTAPVASLPETDDILTPSSTHVEPPSSTPDEPIDLPVVAEDVESTPPHEEPILEVVPVTAETSDVIAESATPIATPVEVAEEEEDSRTPAPTEVATASSTLSIEPAPSATDESEPELRNEVKEVPELDEKAEAPPVGTDAGVAAAVQEPSHSEVAIEEPKVPEEDLDDFLSELGVDFSEEQAPIAAPSPSLSTLSQVPQHTPDTFAEQAAEFDAQIAAKMEAERLEAEQKAAELAAQRAEIVDRHVAWQTQLDELVKEQAKRIFVEIQGVRIWSVGELGVEFAPEGALHDGAKKVDGLPQSKYQFEAGTKGSGLGNKVLEGLNKQGARFLRGLETYLGSLEARRKAWVKPHGEENSTAASKRASTLTSETSRWEEVLGKVQAKFDKMIMDVEGEVHQWYLGIKSRETEILLEASEAVKQLAERAQTDLAMDYAWLDDVTTKDWASYHELMTTYEIFRETAYAIHNGSYIPPGIYASEPPTTSPLSAESDPLGLALNSLEEEFESVVGGFNVGVGQIKKRAAKVLSDAQSVTDDDETSEGFFSVKHEKGQRVDDMREYLAEEERKKAAAASMQAVPEPTVSILPIEGRPAEGIAGGGSRFVIGKDPVQVEEALKKAEKRDEL